MKNFLKLITLFAVLASTVLLLRAQTLEDITEDSASYYGEEVTLEGVVQNFLSPHIFILGEDTFLDNDQVIVINRSGNIFSPGIYEEVRVSVTGVIQPSRDAWEDGAAVDVFEIDSEVGTDDYWGDISGDVEVTDNASTFNTDTTSLYYNGRLSDDYDNYTVLVITDSSTVNTTDDDA